jgi:hypothetical protein
VRDGMLVTGFALLSITNGGFGNSEAKRHSQSRVSVEMPALSPNLNGKGTSWTSMGR